MKRYLPRLLDRLVGERLAESGAVLIEGPKACGKTATGRHHASSEVLLDVDLNARAAAAVEPRLILDGAKPRLIDEWQLVPDIWNAVRRSVDDVQSPGQFILTGSATPADDATRHTGAGRFSRLRMRPFTLFESGNSPGAVSLAALMDGSAASASGDELSVSDIVELIVRGGWPAQQASGARHSWLRDYVEELRHARPQQVTGVSFDPLRLDSMLQSIARNVATEVSNAALAADMSQQLETAVRAEAVSGYVNALEQLMVIERLPAWSPQLRSRSRLRQSPVMHFVDPALAPAALGATADDLLADLNYLGHLFECLVIRDLRVYAQLQSATVSHYRDNTGLEADAIISRGYRSWSGFEIKLGASPEVLDQAASNLRKIADRVDTSKVGSPSCLGVITGRGAYAYQRADGVWVIPIGLLGP